MTDGGTPGTGRDGDVLAVLGAMLRYTLPGTCADGMCLEISQDGDGIWLRLTRPAASAARSAYSDPAELMVIDAVADRWGSYGTFGLSSTLWALLR
jgi:hypothetical protein